MPSRRLATTVLLGAFTSAVAPAYAEALIWETWTQLHPSHGQFAPSRPGTLQPRMQLATYTKPVTDTVDNPIHKGLQDLALSLANKHLWERSAPLGSNIANKTLLETIQQLRHWNGAFVPSALQQQFELLPITSAQSATAGKFTGYYTPMLVGSRTRTERFNVPVYRPPKGSDRQLSHAAIVAGGLNNKRLEIAWVDDPYMLYIAQLQGSAQIHFTDGSVSTLDYAGDNGKDFRAVSDYIRANGYNIGSLAHANVGRWLRERPDIMRAALLSNPRYIFFTETKDLPKTASGTPVIPGHTVAVDSRYIPHGSVLLAELPRLNNQGQRIEGTEWRILFAQDHGRAIAGDGRFDLYMGVGNAAESATYAVSGTHRAFLVIRKSS